jgi:prevent-host-death family protein
MTMKRLRQMRAGDFKAKCLAVLDEVAATKGEVVITKRGRPVARLVPLEQPNDEPLVGLIEEQGDLVSPIDASWDAAE